jgi:hypothetical protein
MMRLLTVCAGINPDFEANALLRNRLLPYHSVLQPM